MKTPRSTIARVITKQLGKVGPRKLSRELAAYLLDSGRTGELDSLLRDVMQQRADSGIVEAAAISAHPLSAKTQADIKVRLKKAYPKAHQIFIDEQLDADVVAGVKIELPNQQLDLSIRSKLNQFKQLTASGDN